MKVDILCILLIIMLALLMCFFAKIKKNYCMDNLLLYFTIFCPICFSGLGIIFTEYNNTEYVIPFVMYILSIFILIIFFTRTQKYSKQSNLSIYINNVLANNTKIFNILGILALIFQLSILIYPEFKLFDLFTPFKSNYGFRAGDYFSSRLFSRSDSLSQILSILRTAFLPFFFILLYNKRSNAKFVIFIYSFYYYIDYINEYYIQRNKLVLIFMFIILYLLYENKITKKRFKKIILFSIPVIIYLIAFLGTYRVNASDTITQNNPIIEVIESEASTQKYLDECDSLSDEIFFPKMLISLVSAPLFFLPDIDFPTLAYLFTEKITGISYGQSNYYILLPCSFGEAIMIFGKNLSFLYGIFLGLFISLIYNFMKKNKYTKYFLLFIILNYAASFRGSIQSFLLQTINLVVPFIVIILFVGIITGKNNRKI